MLLKNALSFFGQSVLQSSEIVERIEFLEMYICMLYVSISYRIAGYANGLIEKVDDKPLERVTNKQNHSTALL